MKSILVFALGMMLMVLPVMAGENPVPQSHKDKVSYSIGVDIGRTMKDRSIDVDPDFLSKGLRDGLTGGKLLLDEEDMLETLNAFQKETIAKQQELAKKLGEKNKKEGDAFLAANKEKEGVKTLTSGLQYKVIKAGPGTGKKPKATDMVTAHYRGTLIDGTEFDSSYSRGKPVTFPVKGVIPGWTEALQLMEEGEKWQLFVPSNLGYGERGAGSQIGPNATLIFEVELISIQEKK